MNREFAAQFAFAFAIPLLLITVTGTLKKATARKPGGDFWEDYYFGQELCLLGVTSGLATGMEFSIPLLFGEPDVKNVAGPHVVFSLFFVVFAFMALIHAMSWHRSRDEAKDTKNEKEARKLFWWANGLGGMCVFTYFLVFKLVLPLLLKGS